jgi:HK97 family phage major capsid protein
MFKNKQEFYIFRNQLLAEAEQLLNAGDIEGFNNKEAEIKKADEQFEAMSKAQANLNAMKKPETLMNMGSSAPLNTAPNAATPESDNPFASLEYRKCFMNFAKTGVMDSQLQNANAATTTSDVTAVIPTTIMQEVIKGLKVYGHILKRVRQISVKGGVEFPILSLKPIASWIGEAKTSDRQKLAMNTKVSFGYHGLECKVATSLLADATTLDVFESMITGLIVEAVVIALESTIINGSGNGQPLGITKDPRIPEANIITLSAANMKKWDGWKKEVFAKIPLAYRVGGSFLMAAGTFEGYIDGLVDANGQPVGRVNYGITDGPQERFGGREVILVEDDVVKPYESAATGDVIAVFCKLGDYTINSNMQMTMYRWLDHDTNQYVDKAILVADGKILDPNGVIIVKKGA